MSRVERGQVHGHLAALTPCLLLAGFRRQGRRRWRHGGARAGLFCFEEHGDADRFGYSAFEGLILPLALCRDPALRGRLAGFAALLPPPDGLPASGWSADRRGELQAWLDREGLGTLKLAERVRVRSWTRFDLDGGVFAGLLPHFDYVTALADDAGRASRILEHRPVAWRSLGSLLDWAMDDGDRGDGDLESWVPRFELFLASDIRGLSEPLRARRSRRQSFRPTSYWTAFAQPDPSARSAAVSVRFSQGEADFGWIDLDLGLDERTARITLSRSDDPFLDLMDWLQAVREGDLPIGVEIDEESARVGLVAHGFDAHRLMIAVLERGQEGDRLAGVVHRTAFLDAFRRELVRFLRWELNVARWLVRPDDLVAGDEADEEERQEQRAYLGRLLAHPFVA